MTAVYTVQPVTDFSIFTTPAHERKGVQFKAKWEATVNELRRELDYLDASDVVLEIGVNARDIRKDGMLRADAKPGHPGVRLSFQCDSGALSFTCDTYEQTWAYLMPSWQANVRAIVKTLEALRAVDRYGATKGEQYAGFKALGAGTGGIALGGMTKDDARALLLELSQSRGVTSDKDAWRQARFLTHPDRNGGDQEQWDRVELAAKVLGLTS